MPDYPIIDTHTHPFPTKAIGKQAMSRLPYPGASGVVEDLLADDTAKRLLFYENAQRILGV